jgi:hypothetical protein
VVPSDYAGYFAGSATAAGTLIGLLFVSVSLRTESIFGADATSAGRALAGSSFTSLVNAFFVAVVALIPGTNIGYTAAIVATSGTVATLRLDRHLPGRRARLYRMSVSLLTFLAELVLGILLIIRPHDSGLVGDLSYVLIALFGGALNRAWALLEGKHTTSEPINPVSARPAPATLAPAKSPPAPEGTSS